MKKEKKKVTPHVVGDICRLVDYYLKEHKKENKKISGIVFSNEGAKGREPLFDASNSKTGDIFAYWEDEEKGVICISAKESGFEVKAPKNMRHFFRSWRRSDFLITYLDVTHLDVSKTTNFEDCFRHFGGNASLSMKAPACLVGLETWDVSNGFCFDCMFFNAFLGNESVALDLSNWKIKSEYRQSFQGMFYNFAPNADEVILNVTGWDMHGARNLARMFNFFAPQATSVTIHGIEEWRLGNGDIQMRQAFEDFALKSGYHLDLSDWAKKCNLKPEMDEFSKGTFFRVKKPVWEIY